MTMRRRTSGVLALVLGAAVLSTVPSAQSATWLPGVSASGETSDVRRVGDPQVVVDAAGAATAVWWVIRTVDDGFFTIDVQTSTRAAGAADYGPVQTLGVGDEPKVALHPDGAVTLAWDDGPTTWASTREQGGSTFPMPEIVASAPDTSVGPPNLSVDGAGNVWASWRSQDDPFGAPHIEICWTARRDAETGSWGAPEPFAEGSGVNDCLLEAATDGSVTYAWAVEVDSGGDDFEQVWTRTRAPGGELGDPSLDDYTPGELGHLALTDNAAGATALSWTRTGAAGADLQVAVRATTDGSFGTHYDLSGDEPVEGAVALVLDEAGRVTGGWAADLAGVFGVTRASDGTVSVAPLDVGTEPVGRIDAVVDAHGAVTLAWRYDAGSFALRSSRRPAQGAFETPTTLTDVADGLSYEPALGVAPSGDVSVVYGFQPAVGSSVRHVRAQVLDVNAPTLTATVPTAGTIGSALSMTASSSDLWGPVSVTWDFGDDGTTATGTSASHAYAGAGSFTVRVTATDASGNSTVVTRNVSVAAATAVGDRTPPVLSRVRLAPDLLPTGHGATLKVTSTEAGRLVGVVERRRTNGHWRQVGTKSWSLVVGRSSKTFYGKAARLRLDAGKHRVRLVATDAAGNASSPVVVRFRVGPRS